MSERRANRPLTLADIARRRLQNERLVGTPFSTPEDVVTSLGAVQAQDYAGAKWAVALRARSACEADVERAIETGQILRTHVLRPTWHFVAPADIRWMLELTAPRVKAKMAYYARKRELDAGTFRRTNRALAKALEGGRYLTRVELGRALADAGVRAEGERLGHIMMHAELDGVVCNGPQRGKQFTYALLDERVPLARRLTRDEALAALTKRYFTSHGPARESDFAWWSGLTIADAKQGLRMCEGDLVREIVEGSTFWLAPGGSTPKLKSPIVHLLPNYDELLIAYQDHRASFDPGVRAKLDPRNTVLANYIVVLDGKVIGGWRRTFERGSVVVETKLLVALDAGERRALEHAGERFGRFLATPVEWKASRGPRKAVSRASAR